MDITKHIKTKFLTGLIFLIPLIVTVYIVNLIISFFEPLVAPTVRSVLSRLTGREIYVPGVGFILFIIITYATGVLATNYFGKRALVRAEGLLKRIPFVKGIYGSVKDMTDAFSSDRIKSFNDVVLVEFPFPGRYAIGFVTKKIQIAEKQLCSVFIPLTPNPTASFLIMVSEKDLTFLDISAEDALKHIISLGTTRHEFPWKEKKSFLS